MKLNGESFLVLITVALCAASISGCESDPGPSATPAAQAPALPSEQEIPSSPLELTSSAFSAGEPIPTKFTCDGEDISPALLWSNAPENTASFALIVDDPDAPAGTWVHWVLFNLPADRHELPEGVAPDANLAAGGQHGNSSWKRMGYGGPCPPGGTHRYFFKLYALDTSLALKAGATKADLEKAMQGHILAQAELVGTYARQ